MFLSCQDKRNVAPIRSLGFKNIDRFVVEATAKRESMVYTDPSSGKVAKIDYSPFTLELKRVELYNEVRVYLLPKELSSYQRIYSKTNEFSEKLKPGHRV